MGLGSRDDIARRLIARGWNPDTRAAVLVAASTPDAHIWIGTIRELAHGGSLATGDGAGTIVIGEVVRVGEQLALATATFGRAAARSGHGLRRDLQRDDASNAASAVAAGGHRR